MVGELEKRIKVILEKQTQSIHFNEATEDTDWDNSVTYDPYEGEFIALVEEMWSEFPSRYIQISIRCDQAPHIESDSLEWIENVEKWKKKWSGKE